MVIYWLSETWRAPRLSPGSFTTVVFLFFAVRTEFVMARVFCFLFIPVQIQLAQLIVMGVSIVFGVIFAAW